jgi:hypothetical protein
MIKRYYLLGKEKHELYLMYSLANIYTRLLPDAKFAKYIFQQVVV